VEVKLKTQEPIDRMGWTLERVKGGGRVSRNAQKTSKNIRGPDL